MAGVMHPKTSCASIIWNWLSCNLGDWMTIIVSAYQRRIIRLEDALFCEHGKSTNFGIRAQFSYQNHLIHGKRIGVRAIQDAALKYYEEKVASFFATGRFLHETFAERCSISSLKELLEKIVTRARELRSHKSAVFDKIPGRPPTSHFHVPVAFEQLLSSLELQLFLNQVFCNERPRWS